MWMIEPKLLCNQHLLGEHKEIHQLIGSLRNGKSIRGYVQNGLVDVNAAFMRHFHLACEMVERGMNHHSSISAQDARMMGHFCRVSKDCGSVDVNKSYDDLKSRCAECKRRITSKFNEVSHTMRC